MSYSQYLSSVTKTLRDRVLVKVDDGEARSVLEAAIRALAGMTDSLDEARAPALPEGLSGEETKLPNPPESAAVRPHTARAIAQAAERVAGGADAAPLVAWERALMAEGIATMKAQEKPSPAAMQESGPDPLLILPQTVEAYFREKYDDSARVSQFRQAIGGRSRQTVIFNLEGNTGLPRELVVQRDHPAGISPRSVVDEYPVLELLAPTPMKSARPVLVEASGAALGAPFMVTVRSSGSVAGPDYFDPPKDPALAVQLAGQLAILHSVDPSPVVAGLSPTLPEGESWTAELDRLEATWEKWRHWPCVSATAAFGWMRAHVGDIGAEKVLIHNDAAFHNILVEDGTITALLDWELVHLGHPAEDLGYCRPFIQEMGQWEAFLDAYVAAGGQRFPRSVIDYFSMRSQLHLMTLMQAGGRSMFENGVTDDINLAEVGTSFMPKVMLRLANIVAEVLDA
jgi:aminoglycoside phosphotransferase (APT) family kinase protein